MQLLNINYYITTIILLFYYSTILLHYITLFHILHLGPAAYHYNKITEDSVASNLHRGLQILRPTHFAGNPLTKQRETQNDEKATALVQVSRFRWRRLSSESEGPVKVGCG